MFATFKEACMARGLLEDNHEWRICLEEAIAIQPGMACHWLLVVILLTDEVAEPHLLWDQFKAGLCDDVKHKLHHMNHYQAAAFDAVLESVTNNQGHLFFIHAAGGCGKIFLYNTIAAEVRRRG